MKTLKDLLIEKKVEIATLPKSNGWAIEDGKINFPKIESLDSLIVYTIEHDYSGISAHMQNYTFDKLNKDSIKSLFLIVSKENSKELYETLKKTPNYVGGGAGSGLKEIILDYMDVLEDSAKDLNSVNAIYKNGDDLVGFNTDGLGYRLGLEKLLDENSLTLKNKKITILGAGGVAMPIVYELSTLNPSEIIIVNRTVEKAQNIANYINNIIGSDLVMAKGEGSINLAINDSSLIVNVSNKGADGRFSEYTAFAKIYDDLKKHDLEAIGNLEGFSKNGIVSDIVLSSKPLTKTLQMAKNSNFLIQNGNDMVLYQGVPALKKILDSTPLKNISEEDLFVHMKNSLE